MSSEGTTDVYAAWSIAPRQLVFNRVGCVIQSLFLDMSWGRWSFSYLYLGYLLMVGGSFSTYLVCNCLLPSIAGDCEELGLFTGGMVTVWDHTYVCYDNLLALDSCWKLQRTWAAVISRYILLPFIWQS